MSSACTSAPFVLLDDSRAHAQAGASLLFTDPLKIICARSIEEVPAALREIDEAVAGGLHVAGWIAYEVAAVFEPRVNAAIKSWPDEPLVWMMVTESCRRMSARETDGWIEARCVGRESNLLLKGNGLAQESYLQAVDAVQDYIAAGDIYQANFTFPKRGHIVGDAVDLYRKLRQAQPVEYGAFIDTGAEKILSLSPELFVRRSGEKLMARPMKGTAARHADGLADQEAASGLARDEKSRAENLMIVDLIRNDLSRVAKPGSVQVSDLFTVESYPTLHQMTSGIEADCESTLTPSALLGALFPCGSVTGAPKIRAMEVIAELEQGPRGVYCGGIGHFSSGGKAEPVQWALNVPIRTFVVDATGACTIGIGSGIVADSERHAEYNECQLKASFADAVASDSFFLIETMRCEGGRVDLLDRHLDRLAASARAFDIPCDKDDIAKCVADACPVTGLYRVRLTLDAGGDPAITVNPFTGDTDGQLEVMIAKERIHSTSEWLQHKSSQRSLYDVATKAAAEMNLADILFLNERGELVEGAISNLFLELPEGLVTPPLDSGALPGVLRATLLTGKEQKVRERTIYPEDLARASAVYVGNALRGLRKVVLRRGEACLEAADDSSSSH